MTTPAISNLLLLAIALLVFVSCACGADGYTITIDSIDRNEDRSCVVTDTNEDTYTVKFPKACDLFRVGDHCDAYRDWGAWLIVNCWQE